MIRKLFIVAACLGFVCCGAAQSEAHYTGPRPIKAAAKLVVAAVKVPAIVTGKTLKAIRPKNVAKRMRSRRVARQSARGC